jgi:hypothetical protein
VLKRRSRGLALVAIAVAAAWPGAAAPASASAGPGTRPCGSATDGTYLSTAFAVASRISEGERSSGGVTRALAYVEADTVLANAVADDDLATVDSEVRTIVIQNHDHIVRLRVLRDGRLLDDVGGPLVLSPVTGSLRVDGRVVGSFVLSVQDDLGYRGLVERLADAHIVIRYQGETIMTDIAAVPAAALPARGSVSIAGVRYLVESFHEARFPSGELDISLLWAAPTAASESESCPQVAADYLAGVAERTYHEAQVASWFVGDAETELADTPALPAALAAGDDAQATQIATTLFRDGGFARLRIDAGTHVVADVGPMVPLIAPLTGPLTDAAGQTVGEAIFSVETAHTYLDVARSLTGAEALIRASATDQIAGTVAGPAKLPTSGAVSYLGATWQVASFAASTFPAQSVRVYMLLRG